MALCLGIMSLTVIDLGMGVSLVGRIGRTSTSKASSPPGPEVSMADFTAAAACVR
jgi:hypothetical protein